MKSDQSLSSIIIPESSSVYLTNILFSFIVDKAPIKERIGLQHSSYIRTVHSNESALIIILWLRTILYLLTFDRSEWNWRVGSKNIYKQTVKQDEKLYGWVQVKLLIFLFVNYRVSQLGSGHVFTILLGYNSMVEAGPLQLTLSGARNEPSRRKPLLG